MEPQKTQKSNYLQKDRQKAAEGLFGGFILFSQKGTEGISFFIYQKVQKGAERTFVPVVVLLVGCPVAALVIWWAAHG